MKGVHTMEPSTLFSTIKGVTIARQLDYNVMIALPDKSWEQVCDLLDLGEAIHESFDEQEAKKIVHIVRDSYVADLDKLRQDRDEIEHDLRVAQGCSV